MLNNLSGQKMSKSLTLNKMGMQKFRIWLAEKRYNSRPKYLTDWNKEHIETLERDGIVVIPDFLPQEEFEMLERDCLHALDTIEKDTVREDGPNFYTNISSKKLQGYASIKAAFNHPKIKELFNAAERRKFEMGDITTLLACLIQGEDNGREDPETVLHEDTFHNTHKAWLYISDVEYSNAPFVYVKESHKNDVTERYKRAYEYSCREERIHSRRIDLQELDELNLKETSFLAKKNTLVLANTLGFHKRLRGTPGHNRVALAFSARFNPFI